MSNIMMLVNREARVGEILQGPADAVKEVRPGALEHYYVQKSRAEFLRGVSSLALSAVTGLCLGWQDPVTGFKLNQPLFKHTDVIVEVTNADIGGKCGIAKSWFDNAIPNLATLVCWGSLALGVTSMVSSLKSYLNSLTITWLKQDQDSIVVLRKDDQLYVVSRPEYDKDRAGAFANHAHRIPLL